ncbi:MAG: ATP-binding cassette domain-containing protein, partial [Pseudomonadota bacterium]|nr:ATP-binding cassette domain-containing protein [Pseudomonadota bacterium]
MNTINKNNSTHSQRNAVSEELNAVSEEHNAVNKERNTAIEVSNLQFSYTKESPPIIDIKAWQVSQGEHVFLSGPSGSGKSTLLNLLCGTLTPTQGDIALLAQPFSALSNRQRDKFRARNIGVVFQQFNLIPYLSVAQNINAAVYFASTNVSKTATDAKLRHLLDKLQLPSHVLHAKADALSIGQQQR